MKANAPEKIYFDGESKVCKLPVFSSQNIEYTRTDAFVEKALKWYCLDCECNDNCKDTKCFFYRAFERYLNGAENCLPPKFTYTILNEDGSTSDNWRYRHFTNKMQDAFVEKACSWLENNLQGIVGGSIYMEDFRKHMEGE